MLPPSSTPPFVRWTLAYRCPLREFDDVEDPDRTDRLLRGVRAYSDALSERRVMDGVAVARDAACSEQPLGFRVADVLDPLDGEERIASLCHACAANAIARRESGALAGCVGHVVPPLDDDFHQAVARACRSAASEAFAITSPRWFGLWIDEQPNRAQRLALRDILMELVQTVGERMPGVAQLLAAVEASLADELPLVVRSYPGGRCQERDWIVEPHCARCKAAWPEERRQQCRVCGQVGRRQRERRRRRMGERPYRPLRDFLSEPQQAALLARLR
jgi:hypothetical protein